MVDNPEKSGIIENMAANDFEIRRENPKYTKFDPYADYSVNISALSDTVNNGLSDACRRVAEDGTKNRCEALSLIDLGTGKQRHYELGDYDSVGGKRFQGFIEKNQNGKFAFVHNHPTDGFLSSVDMQTFISTEQIKIMISTSNDGLKRIVFGDIKDSRFLENIYQVDVNDLRKQIKNGTLEMVEYPYELQKLLVENAIRDYGNFGFWEVDGRV